MDQVYSIIKESQSEIILILCIVVLFLLILLFLTMINFSIFKGKYQKLNKGTKGKTYDEHILANKQEIEKLKEAVSEQSVRIESLQEEFKKTYSKMTLYKYDAFENQGGKLSFILVLLNEHRDGVILHNIHNNDFTYMYSKLVKRGSTDEVLTKEEKEVLLRTI